MKATNTICLTALLALPAYGHPRCLGEPMLSVAEEAKVSAAVIVGEAAEEKDLFENPEAPGAVTAKVYRVRVEETLRGRAPGTIYVRSENTPARFVMNRSERYVLFLQPDAKAYAVDACGSSGPLKERREVVEELRGMKRM